MNLTPCPISFSRKIRRQKISTIHRFFDTHSNGNLLTDEDLDKITKVLEDRLT